MMLTWVMKKMCGFSPEHSGCAIYEASLVLIAFLDSGKHWLQHRDQVQESPTANWPSRVLELGAGVGAVALAFAQHGVKEVVATDIDPTAIKLMNRSIRANQLGNCCRAMTFAFGDDPLPLCQGQGFDLVVSVDTMYYIR